MDDESIINFESDDPLFNERSKLSVKFENATNNFNSKRYFINQEFLLNHKKSNNYSWNNCSPKSPILFNKKIFEVFDQKELNKNISEYHKNIACSVQKIYEEVFFDIFSNNKH